MRIRSELLILLLRWGEQKDRIHARDLPENDHAILATLFASLALADDFKTSSGKEYKDATVSRVEPDGIVLKSKSVVKCSGWWAITRFSCPPGN